MENDELARQNFDLQRQVQELEQQLDDAKARLDEASRVSVYVYCCHLIARCATLLVVMRRFCTQTGNNMSYTQFLQSDFLDMMNDLKVQYL